MENSRIPGVEKNPKANLPTFAAVAGCFAARTKSPFHVAKGSICSGVGGCALGIETKMGLERARTSTSGAIGDRTLTSALHVRPRLVPRAVRLTLDSDLSRAVEGSTPRPHPR